MAASLPSLTFLRGDDKSDMPRLEAGLDGVDEACLFSDIGLSKATIPAMLTAYKWVNFCEQLRRKFGLSLRSSKQMKSNKFGWKTIAYALSCQCFIICC